MTEVTKNSNIFQLRDWRVSKFPLRMVARGIFLTYMWAGFIHVYIMPEFQRANNQMKANGLEYLTVLGFLGTTCTIFICALNEFFPRMKGFKIGLNGFFLVVETLITSLYWGLYFLKPDLILNPDTLRSIGGPPPYFMDTAAHLIPFIAMLSEFFFTRSSNRHLYEQRAIHLIAIGCFTFGYFVWIVFLFKDDNNFPYPFLKLMNNAGRLGFTIFSMFLGLFVYGVASWAYLKYNATEGDLPVYEEEMYEADDDDDEV